MQSVVFTHNYNGKLFLDCFGAVVLYDRQKFSFSNQLEVILKHKKKGSPAIETIKMGIVQVEAIRTVKLKEIDQVLSYSENGESAVTAAHRILTEQQLTGNKIDQNALVNHIVLCYKHRNLENQKPLLDEWWQEKITNQNKNSHGNDNS